MNSLLLESNIENGLNLYISFITRNSGEKEVRLKNSIWCICFSYNGKVYVKYGYLTKQDAIKNRSELYSFLYFLLTWKLNLNSFFLNSLDFTSINIYTDSYYLVNCLDNFKHFHLKKKFKDVKNKDLLFPIYDLTEQLKNKYVVNIKWSGRDSNNFLSRSICNWLANDCSIINYNNYVLEEVKEEEIIGLIHGL